MGIIKGSNLPLVLSNLPCKTSDILDCSVSIFHKGTSKKHWGLANVTLSEGKIVCPLTQNETMALDEGYCYVECKITITGGIVLPIIRQMVEVERRDDTTVMTNSQTQTVQYTEVKLPNLDVDTLVGASAYEVWLRNGHTGSESDFLASLKGADGSDYVITDDDYDAIANLTKTKVGIENYPTKTEVSGTYATKSEVGSQVSSLGSAISSIGNSLGQVSSKVNALESKEESDIATVTGISNSALTIANNVNDRLNDKADASYVNTQLDARYTKSEVDTKLNDYAKTTDLSVYAKKSETPTKDEYVEQKKRLDFLYMLNKGISYTFSTDSTEAYSKSIPTGSKLMDVNKIGGKSLVWNQLSYTNNEVTKNAGVPFKVGTSIVQGHKYYLCADMTNEGGTVDSTASVSVFVRQDGTSKQSIILNRLDQKRSVIATALYSGVSDGTSSQNEGNAWIYIYGVVDTAKTKNIKLIDLTKMFGSGNEPTTVAQVEALLTQDYYAYNSGEIIHASVDGVRVRGKNLLDVTDLEKQSKYTINASIRNLEGYGWSAGSVYNEVDFVNKKFIKRVGRVDLGSLSWGYTTLNDVNQFYVSDFNGKTGYFHTNFITSMYSSASYNKIIAGTDKYISLVYGNIRVTDSSYTNASTFKTAMNGVYLYYELQTPVETDITDLLTTSFEEIEVEGGGSVTFEQTDANYHISIPNSEEFLISLAESN